MPHTNIHTAATINTWGAALSGLLAALVSCGTTLLVRLLNGDWTAGQTTIYIALVVVYLVVVLGEDVAPSLARVFERHGWLYVLLAGVCAFALQAISGDTFLQPIVFAVPLVPIAMRYNTGRTLMITIAYLALMSLGLVIAGRPADVRLLGGVVGFGVLMGFVIAFARLSSEQIRARERADALAHDLEQQRDQLRTLNEVSAALAREEERNRLARELHDTIAQGLTAVAMQLAAAQKSWERDPKRARARVQRADELTRETLADVRRSVWDLAAPQLDGAALKAALAEQTTQFTERTSIQATVQQRGPTPMLDSSAAHQVVRIVQEALKNVEKHAHAQHVVVTLETCVDRIVVSVVDDGCGVNLDALRPTEAGFGLRSLHERARLAGGDLQLASALGAGTQVRLVIETPQAVG